MKEGDTVSGTVRSLTDYGAFVDLGGVDALLHVSDIAWSRVNKAADVLSVGQQIEAKVLKISSAADKRRISVGMSSCCRIPGMLWPGKIQRGRRVRGTVTRVAEFGAFVELEPGIEGLIQFRNVMGKKLRSASTLVKPRRNCGRRNSWRERRRAPNVAGIETSARRSLGRCGAEVCRGHVIEGPVVSITKFGAFVQLSEGVEGMIHISDMSAEKAHQSPPGSAEGWAVGEGPGAGRRYGRNGNCAWV